MQTAGRIALATLGLMAVVAAVSATPATDTAEDQAALRAADQTFMRAYWQGDLERVVALYAEEVLLPANAPEVKGRNAIRKYYAADMAGLKPGESGTIVESTQGVSGNLGWSSGRVKDTAANGATTSTGKFLSVSRKVNGKWLYIRDTWNSDGPP